MAQYQVHCFCDECGQTHPTGIGIRLDDGPADRQSVGNAYAGRELPPSVATLRGNQFPCPVTKRMTVQQDNDQVFLVPVEG